MQTYTVTDCGRCHKAYQIELEDRDLEHACCPYCGNIMMTSMHPYHDAIRERDEARELAEGYRGIAEFWEDMYDGLICRPYLNAGHRKPQVVRPGDLPWQK